ncbi:hypothetical protein GCM10009828_092740 [Actinoplanes couchii]
MVRGVEPQVGSREPGAGSREPGAGSPGAGSWELGAGSGALGAGNGAPGIGNGERSARSGERGAGGGERGAGSRIGGNGVTGLGIVWHHRRVIRLYSLFVLVDLVLIVCALISCLSAEEHEIRALPRVVWVFLILLFSPIGGIAWFVAGRPARPITLSNGTVWRPGSGFPEKQRPRAPDDDPEFLNGINKKDDEDLMKKWEADLRRREEEMRRKETGES